MVILELRFKELVLKEYTLKDGDRLTIGRHPDNDIVPKDEAVSKHHAIIERIGEKLIVLDKESRNGTFVNGKRGYCQLFCVKLVSASFLKNGRFLATFPIGFDRHFSSIFKQTKARSV